MWQKIWVRVKTIFSKENSHDVQAPQTKIIDHEQQLEYDLGKAASLLAMAQKWEEQGRFLQSESIFQEVLSIRNRILGAEHVDLVPCLEGLARLHRKNERFGQAKSFYEQALSINATALGPHHPDVILAQNRIAALYDEQKVIYSLMIPNKNEMQDNFDYLPLIARWEKLNAEALKLYRQGKYAIGIRVSEKALTLIEETTDLERISRSLNNLAALFHAQGLYDQAEPFYQRALTINEKFFGLVHSETANVVNNLGMVFKCKGLHDQAELFFRRALTINENVFGPESVECTINVTNLAGLLKSKGLYDQATPLYEKVVTIREKTLGIEHPHTLASQNNLASQFHVQGLYGQAELLYRRVLAIREKTSGLEHPDTGFSINNLAELVHSQGLFDEAESLYQRALAIQEKVLGPEHPQIAISLNNFATLLYDRGLYEKVEPLLQRALIIRLKVFGEVHPDTANNLNSLGALFFAQGLYAQAEPLYQRALAIQERILGKEHPDIANSMNNLAALFHALFLYDKAESMLKRVLTINEKAFGSEHPKTAVSLNGLASLLKSQGLYDQAKPLYEKALMIQEKFLGPEHPDTAICLNYLAVLFISQSNYDRAKPFLQRALDIREKTLGFDHPDTAFSMSSLGRAFEFQGEYKHALSLYERAFNIYKRHPSTLPSIFEVAKQILNCWTILHNPNERAKDISQILRERLTLINMNNAPVWRSELHEKFNAYHIEWLKCCLADNDRHAVTMILSLVSGWRMGQAIIDAQVRDDPTKPEPVRRFFRLRHEQKKLVDQIEAISSQSMDPVKAEALNAKRDELRHQYDQQYPQLVKALNEAAKYPEYAAIGSNFGSYDEQLRFRLNKGEAIAFLIDFPGQDFQGILLQSLDHAHWFDLVDPAEGLMRLDYFNETYASGRGFRGSRTQITECVFTSESVSQLSYVPKRPTLLFTLDLQMYGQHKEGDKKSSLLPIEMAWANLFDISKRPIWKLRALTSRKSLGNPAEHVLQHAPIEDASSYLAAEEFWPAFGQWIEAQLWLPLKDALQEQKITHLNLITQGRTHSLPWEMNAPADLRLSRFPNSALFAMHKGLVPRPQSNYKEEASANVPSLGLAASVDSDIPCAAMEIELIKNLWMGTIHSPYDYLSPPLEGVVAGHFSGHGVHRDDTPQKAYLEMGSTPWTVPEMMSSRIHPKRIFLSACVAGRTTETGEGDLYGFVTGLMQCGVQELSAATLNMDDMWMLALAINVQGRLHDDPKLTQGEALAQAKISLEKGELVTQEVKQAWFNALMKMRFDTNIAMILRGLNRGQEYIALKNYVCYLDVENADGKCWWDNIVQESEFTARTAMISKSVNTIPWRRVPPQPILGSLLHAVLHFG